MFQVSPPASGFVSSLYYARHGAEAAPVFREASLPVLKEVSPLLGGAVFRTLRDPHELDRWEGGLGMADRAHPLAVEQLARLVAGVGEDVSWREVLQLMPPYLDGRAETPPFLPVVARRDFRDGVVLRLQNERVKWRGLDWKWENFVDYRSEVIHELLDVARRFVDHPHRNIRLDLSRIHDWEYPLALELWHGMILFGDRLSSLSMTLPYAMALQFGPYPFEERKMGTIFTVGEAPFDQLKFLLRAMRAVYASEEEDYVRIALPSDIGRRILHWGYAFYDRFLEENRSVFERMLVMNERLISEGKISKEDQAFLIEAAMQMASAFEVFQSYDDMIRWVRQRMVRRSQDSTPSDFPSLSHAIHDLPRRLQTFRYVEGGVHRLREGRGLDRWTGFFEVSANRLVLKTVLAEAVGLAADDLREIPIRTEDIPTISNMNDVRLKDAKGNPRLADVIANLVGNAGRYHNPAIPPDERRVRLETTVFPDGSIEVAVADNGIGFLPANLDRIGAMSFREARQEVEGSHGIGLSSVVEALAEMGASPLWVRSVVGEGTEFRFILPPTLLTWKGEIPVSEAVRDFQGSHEERLQQEGFRIPTAAAPVTTWKRQGGEAFGSWYGNLSEDTRDAVDRHLQAYQHGGILLSEDRSRIFLRMLISIVNNQATVDAFGHFEKIPMENLAETIRSHEEALQRVEEAMRALRTAIDSGFLNEEVFFALYGSSDFDSKDSERGRVQFQKSIVRKIEVLRKNLEKARARLRRETRG